MSLIRKIELGVGGFLPRLMPQATAAKSATPGADLAADDWLTAAERTLTMLNGAPGVRIIGAIGDHDESGSGSFARALAGCHRMLDQRVLFVDGRQQVGTRASDRTASVPIRSGGAYAELDLKEADPTITQDRAAFKKACVGLLNSFDRIVISLPTLPLDLATSSHQGRVLGATCDAIFLVCLSRVARHADLSARMQLAALQGFRMAGVVLNDKDLRFGGILSR